MSGSDGVEVRPARAVAFDLDGTLIDSRHDLATAVNRTRAALDRPPLPLEAILGMVGEGARNLVRRALGGNPGPAELDRALALFYEHYERVCTDRTTPYPGLDALLTRLSLRCPLALVTNKPERFARRIVAALGWSDRFALLIGGDSLPTRKPDPEGLLACARHFDVAAAELVLVGDSRIDAETALAAGCPFLFVTWGFARAADREELSRSASASDAGELARLLDQTLRRDQLPPSGGSSPRA